MPSAGQAWHGYGLGPNGKTQKTMKRLTLIGATVLVALASSTQLMAVPLPRVPDGGSTIGLLALALAGLAVLARKRNRQ